MAIETTSTIANALKRVYTDDVLDYFQSQNMGFWEKLQRETKLEANPIGGGLYWRIPLQSAQSIGTPSEGGTVPVINSPVILQGTVNLAQFIAGINVSLILEAVGSGQPGTWKNVMKQEMNDALKDLTKHVNRVYAGTHGTGRLAVVNATVTATTFVGKLPLGTLLIRPKMRIDTYDTDTGGSIQVDSNAITKVVPSTRTMTVTSATFTANHGVYLEDSYGNAPNGLAGLVDDSTNLTTIHGNSRATYEELKSLVLGNSGTARNLTEDLLLQACGQVYQSSDSYVDTLLCNSGVMFEYLQFTRPDRRYTVSGAGTPNYDTGVKSVPEFHWGGKGVPVEMVQDVSPRTLYGVKMSTLRRIGDARPKWLEWGNGNIFQQGITSSSYNTSKQATLAFLSNIAILQPNTCFRIDDISDLQLCGALVGGSDT